MGDILLRRFLLLHDFKPPDKPMKPPLFVHPLTLEERQTLERALRSSQSFTLRRAQILLQSAMGRTPQEIAHTLGCTSQTVRNVIHDFHARGLEILTPQSRRPKTLHRAFDQAGHERLMEIAHTSPRDFGKARSVWTLETLAEVAFEDGLTEEQVSIETIRQAIRRLGSSWQRAKTWITSPDPQYALKKSNATG